MIIVLLLREKKYQNDKTVFIEKISGYFPFSFTNDQLNALEKIVDFLFF